MSFLAPLFFVALAALAIPVLIHLIQREKKQVVRFPSLMFVQRVPYKSVRRRRIHNWLLLMVRLAALALIVLAFARPFLQRDDLNTAVGTGAREVVVLLDQSYSMAYGDHWERARAAAQNVINSLGPDDRASVVFFSSGAEIALRSTAPGERSRLAAAVAAAKPGAGATRYAPALKVAGSILARSSLPRREVVLISDFQRGGWRGEEGARLPEGATLTPVAISGAADAANVAVTGVSLARSTFSNQERVAVTAVAVNRSMRSLRGGQLSLEFGGRAIQSKPLDVEANSSASVTFDPVTVAGTFMRGSVRAGDDALATDNVFHFVVSPVEPVRVIVVDRGGAGGGALYLTRALAIGDAPRFETVARDQDALSDDDLRRASVVVLNDIAVPAALARRLQRFVEGGGGLFVAIGSRASWTSGRGHTACRTAGAGRSHKRGRGPDWRARIRPPGVRAVPRAAQRRLFRREVLRLSHGDAGGGRTGARAFRRWRAGARRTADRHRARAAVGVDARSLMERPSAEAGVSAVRSSGGAAPCVL